MKNIIDYIKKEYFDELYLEAMKDFFGDDLPDCVLESVKNNEYTDYILETLKSHNVDLLIKKIKSFQKIMTSQLLKSSMTLK